MKKKHRFSILLRVSLLFIIAALVSAVLSLVISYQFIINYAARQGRDIAVVAGLAVKIAIGYREEFYELFHDEAFRREIHKDFKYICRSTDIQNLYLYTIDENEVKHDIIIASNNDAEEIRMNERYGYGSGNHRPLYEAERQVLDGNLDGNYELVDNEYGKVFMYILPLVDDDNVLAYIGVDFSFESIVEIARNDLKVGFLYGSLILLLTFIIAVILIKRLVINPIQKLSEDMRNFAKDKELNHEAFENERMFEDEITDIRSSFDEMAIDISKYVTDIEALTQERVSTQTQLDIARKIQCGIIPEEYAISGNGFDIFGFEKPAKEVGGDFYDIFKAYDNNVCVAIGDISGKGIFAALFMVMVKTALREKIRAGASLSDALTEVNRDICLANPENMFATVFVLLLDVTTGKMKYANAGHNPPLLLSEKSAFMEVESGMALGLFDDTVIEEKSLSLKDGEGILIYTDGITESIDDRKELFGEKRLQEEADFIFNQDREFCSARETVIGIKEAVNRHCAGCEQFDDMTCIAVIYHKEEEGGKELSPDIASFKLVRKAILGSLGESEHTRKVILACEEIFANIVSYSGADNVYFTIKRSGDTYSVTYSDNGVPFDSVSAKIQSKEFEELDTGGMGIMLARMYSRDMNYNRIGDRNYLEMKFNIKG
ncbi:MAG: SpoIIE family protein phosphatase [Butyrivibrio sp.]|nr:SpoIIE family protein phosphatase [Butyrivibrio sp.]